MVPATLRNYAAASKIYNVNVVNTHCAGQQAMALSAAGTQQGYYGCKFIGHERKLMRLVNVCDCSSTSRHSAPPSWWDSAIRQVSRRRPNVSPTQT